MVLIDWIILLGYLAGMILLSVFVGRGHKDIDDYYVSGRKLPWWAIAISTMATQTSAVSFISLPAFVAVKKGGGLTWLQYELAVPLAIILVISLLIPHFRKLRLISVYEYLELRFNSAVKYLVSFVFLISRGLATGVGIYAVALVLSVCLNLPVWSTILIIGAVTIIYDTIGGMTAVVYSDVIQTIILVVGIIISILFAIDLTGGIDDILALFPADRLNAIDLSLGLDGKSDMSFWAFLFGGIFIYTSYYGTDQSQVQRELSSRTVEETKKSLIFNGIVRFPLTLLYTAFGISLFAVYYHTPELQQMVTSENPDYLVPNFILMLPAGVKGLLFASLLAAAMSSLDSALNSISAVTMQDLIRPVFKLKANEVVLSRVVTLIWGSLITFFAFYVGQIADTVLEGINKIGSAFYGPVVAAFIIGMVFKKIQPKPVFIGILSGVLFNLGLWILLPQVSWVWWNFTGFIVTVCIAAALSLNYVPEIVNRKHLFIPKWEKSFYYLTAYFILMLLILTAITLLSSRW
ncbi:MAG: sodium/solute symporter [Calditrichaceae bacterium]|nr:sodium/solute symporter [Calditrichaceae bacterium]MBN2708538.1 sodium/solute symporter [Calditrichaceae bacterium]RQV93493.1 MAG: sodium transporter [Calditrichota bacterium]